MNFILTPAGRGLLFLLVAGCLHMQAATLEFAFRHVVNGELLKLDAISQRTAAGEEFSVTRVSYLVGGVALERGDGSWLEFTNAVAWMDAQTGRTAMRLPDVPAGAYRGVRFHVGLDAALNNAPVTNHPPDHALNPNLNGLHWSWQGGYIFLALEGMWRNAAGKLDGWSFHLARDTNRVRINLAADLDLVRDARMEVDFDLAPVLNAPRPISFAKDGSSTHSRDGDPVAAALVANLPGAFRVRRIEAREVVQNGAVTKPLFMPGKFTPYPFQMSAVFPMPDLPRDNPLIIERVALGEKLFHETALSKDGTISCASCHEMKAAFADPRRFSLGVRNQAGTRNAMPLFNLAWKSTFFWDGRAPSLRAQALMPIQDHVEMDESLTNVVAKLSLASGFSPVSGGGTAGATAPAVTPGGKTVETVSPVRTPDTRLKPGANESGLVAPGSGYPARFSAAFGSPEITAEKIGLAIEAFVLTLTSFDSKFDRAFRGEAQLSDEEKRGFELFMTEFDPRREQYGADCFHCHGGALFQSQTFANNGLDAAFADRGRARVTGRPGDEGKFSTPSLRNIALTAPYMHDGRFATLEEVVEHYSSGVKRSTTLDPNLAKHPDGGLRLSKQDKAALVAFLNTLTDEKYERAAVTNPQPRP
jgi:cytochrome c peroxidase